MLTSKEEELHNFLREKVAARTGAEVEAITAASEFAMLGLQSIDAVLLCGEIEEAFSIEIDPADIFEHDTLGEFARSVLERTAG